MSQTEGPESQVRRRVGDAAQAVFYSVDGLMHEHICDIKLLQAAEIKLWNENHKSAGG